MIPCCALYHPQNQHPDWLQSHDMPHRRIATKTELMDAFTGNVPIIGFCAAGILIRQLAGLLKNKWDEPAILLVIGEPDDGFILPLLGGHHGGNHLAQQLAEMWGLTVLTSSATDPYGFAPDQPPTGWHCLPSHHDSSKYLAQKFLRDEALTVYCPFDSLFADYQKFAATAKFTRINEENAADLYISPFSPPASEHKYLQLIPPLVTLGVGMIRDCTADALEQLVLQSLASKNIPVDAVAAIGSVVLKDNEAALWHLAKKYDWQLRFFTEQALNAVNVPNPSQAVKAELGTASVAEASALSLAGEGAELIVEKQKTAYATCAIACADSALDIACLAGSRAGCLTLVGLGPGHQHYRLPHATHCLAEADVIIGYDYYLDMIRQEFPHPLYISSSLGQEQERAQAALDEARTGKNVALIASGDPGIYALATLVMELAYHDTHPPMIDIIPGITAMQMLAARMGAPMGHDFCAISLSDLLTAQAIIRKRILAAAEGDFVIAFYNPQSRKRRTLLAEAIDILKNHRPADTPIIVGRQLARSDETIAQTRLADFDCEAVDMFSLVMVGNSQTRMFGKNRCFTPRGYDNKYPLKEQA